MAPWSLCTVCGMPIREYCTKIMGVNKDELESELEKIYSGMVAAGSKVIKAKGATFYAIAASTVQLVKAIMSDARTILPLSTMLNGEYGIKDMCMGVPCMVGGNGLEKVIALPITEEETKEFDACIAKFEDTYKALGLK